MKDPDFLATLHRVAQVKPALSDVYSVEYAEFVDTLGRLAKPALMKYVFFVEGGALGIENALKTAFDWKVRRNKAKGIPGEKGLQIVHFREAFHGRTGYTLSLTNTDPSRPTTSRSSSGRGSRTPSCASRSPGRWSET